jgi:hypothetical protein
MAKRTEYLHGEMGFMGEDGVRRSDLLYLPDERKPEPEQLHRIIRLLLLCHSSVERRIVAWRFYHRLSLREVAERVGVTLPRAKELWDGLLVQEQAAAVEQRNTLMDERLKNHRRSVEHASSGECDIGRSDQHS